MRYDVSPSGVAAAAADATTSASRMLPCKRLRLLTAALPRKYFPPLPPSPPPQPLAPAGPDHTAALPDELLLRVFRHVDPPELVRSVQHVSPRWGRVAQDESLWRDYEYAPRRGTPARQLTAVLRQSPHLRAFVLPPGADANAALDALSNRCHQLQRLNLEVAARINVRVLKSLFTRLPELRQLQLSQRPRVPGGVYKRLALRLRPRHADPGDMSYFYESLSPPAYRGHSYMFVAKFVLRAKKDDIQHLRLNFVSDEMLRLVQQCEGLEKLRLEFDQYQDTLKTDLQFIRDMSKLESLEIVNYHNDKVLNEIFGRETWPSLKELVLSWCTELSDRTLKTIRANCPNLQTIVLECCQSVTDRGVQHLMKGSPLRAVKLSSCPLLTAESVRLVTQAKSLERLDLTNFLGPVADYRPCLLSQKQLRVLLLKGCIITREDIKEIVLHLKHTKLIADPPTKPE